MFERIRTLLGEKTVQERVDLGREAAAWLGNPAADTALAHMRQVAMDSWLRCRDPRKRDEYWYEIHRIEAFVQRLKALIHETERIKAQDALSNARRQSAPLA